nr:zinc finger, CCHC-type [Tanacetum cinerariifolium]
MASMNTRLNIKKLDENIVQKHGSSKQVGFKKLGPGVEPGVHEVHDENVFGLRWNCRELKGIVKLNFFGLVTMILQWLKDGTGSMQVLHEFEFEVEPLGDHTFEVEPQEMSIKELVCKKEDSNEAAFTVAVVEKIYAHESLTFNNTIACEVISKWKAGLKDDMDARSDVYVLSNGCKKCSEDNDGYYWGFTPGLLDKANENVLGMEIVRDQSGYTLRVSQSRFYNEKLVQNLLEGHSILSLEGSLSRDCDVKKNGMLDKFDRGLQTDVQVFVDFDYAMERSIIVMGRLITGYGMHLGCTGSLKANLQHLEALSTTEVGYTTFTEAWKKKIWLKGLLTESKYELRLVALLLVPW